MNRVCIKKLTLQIENVNDKIYKVVDKSNYTYDSIEDLKTSIVNVKIKTPSREEFSVEIAPLLGGFFMVDTLKLCDLVDGVYHSEVVTCGQRTVMCNIPYYENIERAIDNNLIKNDNKQFFLDLKDQLEIVKTLNKNGLETEATSIYEDLSDQVRGCMSC